MTPQRKAALAVLATKGGEGLGARAWMKVSGLSHSAFFEAIKFFTSQQLVDVNAQGNYYCLPDGPVGPVRSGAWSGGTTESGPVRSGVSIDTGRTGPTGPDKSSGPTTTSATEDEHEVHETPATYRIREQ